MAEGGPKRGLGFIWIMLAVAAIAAAVVRLHGIPAFLSGLAGGVLFVLGITTLFRK